ncbi:MAG: hypothetical protein WCK59_00070 [Candidatus Falkowbacteria bacterium]
MMKKPYFLFLLPAVAAIIVAVVFIKKKEPALPLSKIYTCEQEMQKKFLVFKFLGFVDSAQVTDAFGDQVKTGHWYLRCNSTRVVFPIHPQKVGDLTTFGEDQAELLSFPLSQFRHRKENKEILINNGSAMGVLVKSQVLLLGNNEVFITATNQQLLLR